MRLFQIKSYKNETTLFEGRFWSFRECIEQAVNDKIILTGADLRRTNLTNAMLDDAQMAGVDFSGANLTGANLSEARLHGGRFDGAALYNTCLAYADLRDAAFGNASFGATDITGCDISRACFSSLSCFTLDFALVKAMDGCLFRTPEGFNSPMSRPPVVIRGLGAQPLIFMDRHIASGMNLLDGKPRVKAIPSGLKC